MSEDLDKKDKNKKNGYKNCSCEDCTCTPEECVECDCTKDNCKNKNCKCNKETEEDVNFVDDDEIPTEENATLNCGCKAPTDYLKDLLRVQAEFDNYRKRVQSDISEARKDGFIDAIERFIPALDSFKMATNMITDKNTLIGIRFIEKGILDTLSKMGVQEIDATGKFDPNLHQAIDTDTTSDVESGYITKEAYKGFTYNGKVIRYSQVIVRK